MLVGPLSLAGAFHCAWCSRIAWTIDGPSGRTCGIFRSSGLISGRVGPEHHGLRPVEQPVPEVPGQDQRRVVQVPHLEQLPDHQRFEHRADAAGRDDERVGHQDEVVQPGEERLVLERLGHERVHVLLERQLDADADRLLGLPSGSASFTPSFAACISPGPPPVTMSQPRRVSSAAVSRTAAYTQWFGSTRAEPKMVTR